MFIKNKYYTWYYNIINNACQRKSSGYIERHHIIPRSLGGNNSKYNIAPLTAREHYICHLLLTKFTSSIAKQKMFYALHRLQNRPNSVKIKTSRLYEYLRTNHAKVVSNHFKSLPNCGFAKTKGKRHEEIFGKERSDEIKRNIRKTNTERVWTDEMRQKMSESQKRRHKERPESFDTGPKSEETKRKLSESRKARSRELDKVIYTWSHPIHGTFIGTRYELRDRYPELKINELLKVASSKYNEKSYHKWSVSDV